MQSNTTQVNIYSKCFLYMCATCFGLYLCLSQACQYKNLIKEDITKSKGPCLSHYVCIMLKHTHLLHTAQRKT